MQNKFSHIGTGKRDIGGRHLTLCGRRVDVMSLYYVYESKFIKVAPLCQKCAAAQLIAEVGATK